MRAGFAHPGFRKHTFISLHLHSEEAVCRTPRIPVDQLTTEAKWLSDYLTKAVGDRVTAEPMLALPGWFIIERLGRGPVCVVNPVKATRFFVQSRRVVSDEMAQRIAHQLEQLCRDVTPAFREKKEWANK